MLKDFKEKLPPEELDLELALQQERTILISVKVPVITVSATYRKELADKYHALVHTPADVVFSRAHYSMAEAVKQAASNLGKSTHLSDPTNFVSFKDWKKVEFTETSGQLMARYKVLKWLKDRMDTYIRNKLPIMGAIKLPLSYITNDINCPIISMHYEVGNQLAGMGKSVVQVVTDPHVRPQYLDALPNDKIIYCVFDKKTKKDFLKKAKELKKEVNKNKVKVTGSPVDPRIAKIGLTRKQLVEGKALNLAVCTGGLGTNLNEIKEVLKQLSPLLVPPEKIKLFLYAGTHRDFRNFFEDIAREENLRVGNLDDENADIRILYEDSIIDANKNLIKYMFPWAHGVITKPSGDMAYDAAAAGCFMLFLEPWGIWEENVQRRFIKRKIGFDLRVWDSYDNFMSLLSRGSFNKALQNAHNLPKRYREGAFNIVRVQQGLDC